MKCEVYDLHGQGKSEEAAGIPVILPPDSD